MITENSALPTNKKAVNDATGFNLFTPNGVFHCAETQTDLGLNQDQDISDKQAAPMNGTVFTLLVDPGKPVTKGETLMVIKAI